MKWHIYQCEYCETFFAIEDQQPGFPPCPMGDCSGEGIGTAEIIQNPAIISDYEEEQV